MADPVYVKEVAKRVVGHIGGVELGDICLWDDHDVGDAVQDAMVSNLPPEEIWARIALLMPEDIGGPRKKEITFLMTRLAKGRVLETMCGFNSYFEESPEITEIVALDYCSEMLKRYPFPQRRRILYDLERITGGERMNFFRDGEFQTLGCWGSNYLSNPTKVFSEFHRLLSLGGMLLVLENTSEGYRRLVKRKFDPDDCTRSMQEAGFVTYATPLACLKNREESGEYYLVVGFKSSIVQPKPTSF